MSSSFSVNIYDEISDVDYPYTPTTTISNDTTEATMTVTTSDGYQVTYPYSVQANLLPQFSHMLQENSLQNQLKHSSSSSLQSSSSSRSHEKDSIQPTTSILNTSHVIFLKELSDYQIDQNIVIAHFMQFATECRSIEVKQDEEIVKSDKARRQFKNYGHFPAEIPMAITLLHALGYVKITPDSVCTKVRRIAEGTWPNLAMVMCHLCAYQASDITHPEKTKFLLKPWKRLSRMCHRFMKSKPISQITIRRKGKQRHQEDTNTAIERIQANIMRTNFLQEMKTVISSNFESIFRCINESK